MASGCLEDRASTLYDVAYVLDGKLSDIVFDKSCLAFYDATYRETVV